MIRVRIEYLPCGRESLAVEIGRIGIANDGTGNPEQGNYDVVFSAPDQPTVAWIRSRIEGFQRNQQNVYHLLNEALKSAFDRGGGS